MPCGSDHYHVIVIASIGWLMLVPPPFFAPPAAEWLNLGAWAFHVAAWANNSRNLSEIWLVLTSTHGAI